MAKAKKDTWAEITLRNGRVISVKVNYGYLVEACRGDDSKRNHISAAAYFSRNFGKKRREKGPLTDVEWREVDILKGEILWDKIEATSPEDIEKEREEREANLFPKKENTPEPEKKDLSLFDSDKYRKPRFSPFHQ